MWFCRFCLRCDFFGLTKRPRDLFFSMFQASGRLFYVLLVHRNVLGLGSC